MLLRNERWAKLFIEILYKYTEQGIYKLHAFVVMPEHFHILITPATTLERAVQYIKGSFSREAKLRFAWNYPVWQKGFSDHRIRDAVDCDHHLQYIYNNPLKRHLATKPSEYRYCSAFPGFELDELPQGLKPGWWGKSTARLEAVPLQKIEPNTRRTEEPRSQTELVGLSQPRGGISSQQSSSDLPNTPELLKTEMKQKKSVSV